MRLLKILFNYPTIPDSDVATDADSEVFGVGRAAAGSSGNLAKNDASAFFSVFKIFSVE